ncbi:MAG: hypothetical protein WD972_00175 [Candidatus Andersenbacteria bacterium]
MAIYTLTTWTPAHHDWQRDLKIPKGSEYQVEIVAPDDTTALEHAKKIVLQDPRLLVGTLTAPNDRVIARGYTLYSSTKVAWDDPPEYMTVTHRNFLASSDEEARKQYPPKTSYHNTSNWERIEVHGPDGYVSSTPLPDEAVTETPRYILTIWTPRRGGDPRPPYAHKKGKEQQFPIDVPNDESALKQAEKLLPPAEEVTVGTLKDSKEDRLVAGCYTIHTMDKAAWDDPPEHINDKYDTFFAASHEEALKRVPEKRPPSLPYLWEDIRLYGPR